MMFTRVIIRASKNNSVLLPLIRFNPVSTTVSPEPKNTGAESDIDDNVPADKVNGFMKRNLLVNAAFASLQNENSQIKTPSTDDKLGTAKTIDELLSVSEGNGVSRRHALKVVSILSEWSTTGKVQLADFDNDPRFLRLCRILTKNTGSQKSIKITHTGNSDDLAVVLSVTADDEAAQLIGGITVPQMVKVIRTLSQKKRRSILLLRTIAFNITRSSHQLNSKECSDLLYAMALLNFPDQNLLAKIANDLCVEVPKIKEKSSIIGSILTSIGLMKYKNAALLDVLSDWMLRNHSICRSQDMYAFFMTLAMLNFTPTNGDVLFKELIPFITGVKTGKFNDWLELVWSLVLLNQAETSHVASIFEESSLSKFQENSPLPSKLKLLNIDAAAQYLLSNYDGPRLPQDSVIRKIELPMSKDRMEIVDSVIETLKNLIQSEKCLKTYINTGMGFYIDAEFLLDKKGNPVSYDKLTTNNNLTRIAVISQDFHDMTVGKVEPSGISLLREKLLKAQGYKILSVPYTEFKPKDNLIRRVKYLEAEVKNIVKS